MQTFSVVHATAVVVQNLVVDKWLVNPKNKPSPIGVHDWVILGITVPKMTPDMVACWDGCFLGLPHQFNYKW